MGKTWIQAGMTGADYVYLTPAIKEWLVAHGCRFVARYLVPPETTSINKDLKPAEVEWCAQRQIAIVPVWEIHHRDAYGGAARGELAATRMVQLAQQFNIPTGTHLLVAVDTDTWHGNVDTHAAYVDAFKYGVQMAGYRFGVYGDVDIAAAVEGELFWRANAGGWGRPRPDVPVHIQQHHSLYPPGVDPNTALLPFVAWLPGTHTPEGPTVLTTYNGQPRLVDTRIGMGAPLSRLEAGQVLRVGLPAAGDGLPATAAVVSVTVARASAHGHVQVDGDKFGTGSNGNYEPGTDVEGTPVLATVAEDGTIGVRISHGEADIMVDLMGLITGSIVVDGDTIIT